MAFLPESVSTACLIHVKWKILLRKTVEITLQMFDSDITVMTSYVFSLSCETLVKTTLQSVVSNLSVRGEGMLGDGSI